MIAAIDPDALGKIAAHHRSMGWKYRFKGLPYERCAELPWVIGRLAPRFQERLRYLDVGTGESALPSFLLANTNWEITCLDKFKWVRRQVEFAGSESPGRFNIVEANLLESRLSGEFDIVTCISVIEHFEGSTDTQAIQECARLLARGGVLVLTTLINEGFFAEFHLRIPVYGAESTYYQRHYDLKGLQERLIEPSGLKEIERVYFGDYDFQCFERVMQKPKLVRALYAWNTPALARRHLSYRSYPVSRKEMRMNTASGVIVALAKA